MVRSHAPRTQPAPDRPVPRLAAYRAAYGLTQAALAEHLADLGETRDGRRPAVTSEMISRWETGERRPAPRYRTLLCTLFNTNEAHLGLRHPLPGEQITHPWEQVDASRDLLAAAGTALTAADGDWDTDTLAALTALGRREVDVDRRQALGTAVYSVAALTPPSGSWWATMAHRSRSPAGTQAVGRGDVDAVREMVSLFSRVDQRRGGGHARSAVVQYLTSDVARYLRGTYADDEVRRAMFSATAELAYLSGWMAFDDGQHATAQNWFRIGVQLAAEADDPAMAGHVLRAMAHQAVDLGHVREAVTLSAASMHGPRYTSASPRERALLGIVHARALGAAGDPKAAAAALLHADNDLASAGAGDDEPSRVFFFGEASLAHETACTLRDTGDLDGALREFQRSVRTRKATTFTRTHAVTLGYLGAVQARRGGIEEACATWSRALDTMDGIQSARTRMIVSQMRATLSPIRGRGITAAHELDARAAAYLATGPRSA